MKLVIHAGVHRTGTSTLQDYLSGNRDELLQRGIFYPGDGKNHQPLAWAINRGDAGAEDVLKLVGNHSNLAETAVLSGEDFCILEDLDWLSQVAATYPTTVNFYLRRQDHWLMSWYNQHIKWPFDKWKSRMSASQFLDCIGDFPWIDYAQLVGRWEQVLGEGAVRIAIVEPGQVEDVAADFVRQLGVNAEELPEPVKRINDSMPVHLLDVARHLGMHGMPPGKRIKLIGILKKTFPSPPGLPKTVYSPEQRRDVLNRFAESNGQLARKFFQRDRLFLEADPQDGDPYYSPPDMNRDEWMEEWIKPLVARLLNQG
jgi:hypothetical protein